jgi:hypothetical protein
MSDFQEIIRDYSNITFISDSELTTMIRNLDSKLVDYRARSDDSTKMDAVRNALMPINNYYKELRTLNKKVRQYLNKTSKKISNVQDTLVNEIRYEDRIRPEETTESREVMYGLFPKFKESTLPYVLSAGVFMALLTIFLVLQALGFNSQVTLPQALIGFFVSPAGTVSVPFYKNPMVLGGLVAILGTALIIFIIMYFNKKS